MKQPLYCIGGALIDKTVGREAIRTGGNSRVATGAIAKCIHPQCSGPDFGALRLGRGGGEQAYRAEQQREDGQEKAEAGAPAARIRSGAVPRRRPSRRRRAGRGENGQPGRAGLAPGARHAAGPLDCNTGEPGRCHADCRLTFRNASHNCLPEPVAPPGAPSPAVGFRVARHAGIMPKL